MDVKVANLHIYVYILTSFFISQYLIFSFGLQVS